MHNKKTKDFDFVQKITTCLLSASTVQDVPPLKIQQIGEVSADSHWITLQADNKTKFNSLITRFYEFSYNDIIQFTALGT